MNSASDIPDEYPGAALAVVAVWLRAVAMAIYILALAWAPFPLGSAVDWGAPVLEILIGVSWLFWALSAALRPNMIFIDLKKIWVPGLFVIGVLLWVVVQMLPHTLGLTPHPVWGMAQDFLHHKVPGRISINPWRTQTELLKLCSEVAAFWLALSFSSRPQSAKLLLGAVAVITALYAFYGFILALIGTSQASLVYGISIPATYISGPFMLHNSFATFCGMGVIVTVLGLLASGNSIVVAHRGLRPLALSTLQFVFGSGVIRLVGVVVLLGALIASASRAGFVSTLLGLFAVSMIAIVRARRAGTRRWAIIGMFLVIAPIVVFIVANGGQLGERLTELADAGTADDVRLALWNATERMIGVFPWTGLGLGTFEDAYPMFTTQVLPFVMDKAHCDYLEFAAGVGLPAAIAWLGALVWLAVRCLHGSLIRQRNVIFPLSAFGASVLVAAHSLVDFSLQIPAVALIYATILGIGVAQSWRTKNGHH